jgi:hypothetical protein
MNFFTVAVGLQSKVYPVRKSTAAKNRSFAFITPPVKEQFIMFSARGSRLESSMRVS